MAITFPQNPAVGDEFTNAGKIWRWDGIKWATVAIPISTEGLLVKDDLGELDVDLIPLTNEVQDLGSDTNRWRDLYLSGSTIQLGSVLLKDDSGALKVEDDQGASVPIEGFEPEITAGTVNEYFRGDKTFQPLDAASVGLNNVDNTSDLEKPISNAVQSALNNKIDTSNPIDLLDSGGTGFLKNDGSNNWTYDNNTYLTSETVTSIDLVANILSYTDENNNTTDLDLSLYLDDTNLARIIGGEYISEDGVLRFTRDDNTTFDVDASMFFDDTNLVTSVASKTGAVTLEKADVGLDNVENFEIATQAEAETGTASNKYMTPERTAQAIIELAPDPQIATQAEAEIGTDDTVFMTPLKTKQSIVSFNQDVFSITLASNSWSGSEAPYTQTISIPDITEDDFPFAGVDLSEVLYDNLEDISNTWDLIYRGTSNNGSVTFYANDLPEFDISLIVRK